jgi:3-oxoacyl-[acyl-carrier protein] reductase
MKVLITGGNGSIAQAIKEILEKNNYEVFALNRNELDVTDEEKIKIVMKIFKPDILINNAGYIIPNSIINTSLEEWEKHLKINLTGVLLCSRESIINGCSIIINIGSTSAFEGRKQWGSYCASKCAGLSLIETLVEEGIEAYSLNPARTDTKMRKGLFPNEDKSTLMNPERVGEYILKILNKDFENGSHIILTKDKYITIPKRRCPK